MNKLSKKDIQTIHAALWYAQTLVYPDARLQPEAIERGKAALLTISKNWQRKFYPALTDL